MLKSHKLAVEPDAPTKRKGLRPNLSTCDHTSVCRISIVFVGLCGIYSGFSELFRCNIILLV